jgi:hypothetical protein
MVGEAKRQEEKVSRIIFPIIVWHVEDVPRKFAL